MPTRANAIGRYDGLAPELQDTLRRNGMQARLVLRDGDVLLAVQGHDSPLLTYPLSQSRGKEARAGGEILPFRCGDFSGGVFHP